MANRVHDCQSSQPASSSRQPQMWHRIPVSACHAVRHLPTVILAPTAKVLVQVKRGLAVAQLDVRQPLSHDAEQGSIRADCGANEGDNDPPLCRIVGLLQLAAPAYAAAALQPGNAASTRLGPGLLARRVLYPV